MTEAEWLECKDPATMLEFLRGKVSDQKLRLWACSYTSWNADGRSYLIDAVRAAERWADGDPHVDLGPHAQFYVCFPSAWRAAQEGTADSVANWADSSHKRRATRLLLDNLRCVFGNPFRPVTYNPEWRTSTAVALARQMYESRDFSAMPILSDALKDAGCGDSEILAHCRLDDVGLCSADVNVPFRTGGPHVRGCWVVDLVLGKE